MLAFPNTSSSLTTSWICPRRGISWFNSLAALVQNQVACLLPVGTVNFLGGFDVTLKAVFGPIKIKRSCCSFVIHQLTAAKYGMNGNELNPKKLVLRAFRKLPNFEDEWCKPWRYPANNHRVRCF